MTIDGRIQRRQGAWKQWDRVQQQGGSTADARAARAESIRRHLDRGDVIAEVLRLLLASDGCRLARGRMSPYRDDAEESHRRGRF